jgi:hypothetical protein
MAIIDYHIWTAAGIVDNVRAIQVLSADFTPVDGAPKEAIAEHSQSHEWQSDMLGKEHFADGSGNLCEGIANTANDNVLEWSGDLDEGRALRAWSSIALTDEAVW